MAPPQRIANKRPRSLRFDLCSVWLAPVIRPNNAVGFIAVEVIELLTAGTVVRWLSASSIPGGANSAPAPEKT